MPLIYKTVLAAALVLCSLLAYKILFQYLNLSEEPVKSDAVVLFAGPDYPERLKEVHRLMDEGWADTLIVPAYQLVYTMADGDIVRDLNPRETRVDRRSYPAYYENTHIEALEAKKFMEELGLFCAIMVSDPCHMRRIKIISSHVFQEEKYRIRCIGSRYLRPHGFLSAFGLSQVKFSLTEAVKMIFFLAYARV